MDNESMINIRNEFIDYVGEAKFEKFVRALDNPMERTMFWQEQLWKRFTCDKNLIALSNWEELIKIFETDINKLVPDFKKKHTSIEAICDCCNAAIEKGEGFIFYSSACCFFEGSALEQGNMFLCKSCAENTVNEGTYRKQFPQKQKLKEMDVKGDMMKLLAMMNEANAASIIEHCKRRRLSPEDARKVAHEFAMLWWKNKETACVVAASFWNRKKWWQFWK